MGQSRLAIFIKFAEGVLPVLMREEPAGLRIVIQPRSPPGSFCSDDPSASSVPPASRRSSAGRRGPVEAPKIFFITSPRP